MASLRVAEDQGQPRVWWIPAQAGRSASLALRGLHCIGLADRISLPELTHLETISLDRGNRTMFGARHVFGAPPPPLPPARAAVCQPCELWLSLSRPPSPVAILKAQLRSMEGPDRVQMEEFMFNKSRLLGAAPLTEKVNRGTDIDCGRQPTVLSLAGLDGGGEGGSAGRWSSHVSCFHRAHIQLSSSPVHPSLPLIESRWPKAPSRAVRRRSSGSVHSPRGRRRADRSGAYGTYTPTSSSSARSRVSSSLSSTKILAISVYEPAALSRWCIETETAP